MQDLSGNYMPWQLADRKRADYAKIAKDSARRKAVALSSALASDPVSITATYDPLEDMKQMEGIDLSSLSLFSGSGGLDIGFDRAGFSHVASYDVLEFAGRTLLNNRPNWNVNTGSNGDVRRVDWKKFRGQVDVLHGGPPCQPFSIAGRRLGSDDARDMVPEFSRAVKEVLPSVFVFENVPGFASKKFDNYRAKFISSLEGEYIVSNAILNASNFGVPQGRRRFFLIGSRRKFGKFDFAKVVPTDIRRGVRQALGLDSIGFDGPAPTLRSTLNGPRNTTSVANSTASVASWRKLGIWPHGVSETRTIAANFPAKDNLYRLCVDECKLIQGYPVDWKFSGATYQMLGQIGNSVCPPVGYALASSLRSHLCSR